MGRVFKPKYAYTNAAGARVEKTTTTWYIQYQDATGRCVRRKAGVTKEQAVDALRKAEADVLNEKNGMPAQRAGDLVLTELVRAYMDAKRLRIAARYLTQAQWELDRLFAYKRVRILRQLTPEVVEKYLAHRLEEGKAAKTANAALTCIKAVLNWAVRTRKIPYNPIACIAPVVGEKRHVRRALTDEEITRVLAAALDGPERRGMRAYQNRPRKDGTYKPADVPLDVMRAWVDEGRNNVLAYRLMIEAGLRRNEARSVTWADIDLQAGTLTTRPQWEGNKNGKEETLPLTPGLLAALCSWRESHEGPETSPVVTITDRLLRRFNDDLVQAGLAKRVVVVKNGVKRTVIDKRDSAGRVLDLHALRHTFGTRLGRMPGIDPKSVQTLMRHSDPRMTFGIYVHSDKERLAAAVAALPTIETTIAVPASAANVKIA